MAENEKVFQILVVDDNTTNRQVVSNILEKRGYCTTVVEDGSSALERLQLATFDLILLDVMMPKMDGFEVCTRIKNNPVTKEIPIIFLTAIVDSNSILKGFELGAVDYISKPFSAAELLARVTTHLQLQHTRQLLEEEIRSKNRFFSIIAHDLRSPLHTMLGSARILFEKFDQLENEKKRHFIKGLYSSIQHLDRLLSNLLDWAKIQLAQTDFNPEKNQLLSLVYENLNLLKPLAEAKNIELSLQIEDNVVVFGDRNMLETVVRNLISNAIKFTRENGKISIQCFPSDTFQTITVSDNGIGLAGEDIQKLFRLETNFTRKGTAKEKGSGLGLLLCKEFVEKNGGHIWVTSQIDKGSDFSFTIPSYTSNL